jgi:hypothetical protein
MIYDYFCPRATKVLWKTLVWNSFTPPKYSFTLWLAIGNKLLTRDRLHFLVEDTLCPLCCSGVESHHHLFFSCPFVHSVWTATLAWLGIRRSMSTLASALKWLKKEARGTRIGTKAKKVALACMVHCIWRVCNQTVFEGKAPSIQSTIFWIQVHVYRNLHTLYPSIMALMKT